MLSSTVMQRVRGIIGRSIKKTVNDKRRAAEIHDEALFKDPPAKEEAMPLILICCASLPSATISFADANEANEELADTVACTLSISLEILTSARFAKQS